MKKEEPTYVFRLRPVSYELSHFFRLVKHELYFCEEFDLFNSLSEQTKELQFVNWVW